jgi:hypothetical protein
VGRLLIEAVVVRCWCLCLFDDIWRVGNFYRIAGSNMEGAFPGSWLLIFGGAQIAFNMISQNTHVLSNSNPLSALSCSLRVLSLTN